MKKSVKIFLSYTFILGGGFILLMLGLDFLNEITPGLFEYIFYGVFVAPVLGWMGYSGQLINKKLKDSILKRS